MPRQSNSLRQSLATDVAAASVLLATLQSQIGDTVAAMAAAGQAAADGITATAASLQAAGTADTTLQLQRIQQVGAARASALSQIASLGNQEAAQSARRIETMLAPVSRAVDRSVLGVIQGTTSARQAIARIGQSILAEEISSNAQRLARWIATEAAKTAATDAGTAARAAAEQTGQAAGDAGLAAKALAAITTDSAKTFAGIFAFLAPDMGPYAAAPAAAAQASVLAVAGDVVSAAGGWGRVPMDGVLAQLHKDEMVLPASIASPLRASLGQGGGGQNFHYAPSIQMSGARMSRQDVETMLRDHAGVFTKHIRNALRNGTAR